MADPGQASSEFIAGPTLSATELDIVNDRIPYFKVYTDGRGLKQYLACTVSPADLYAAMSA